VRILLSPAKKMRVDTDTLAPMGLPDALERTEQLLNALRGMTAPELKALWGCNAAIAEENLRRLEHMELRRQLTPAVLAYDGIAYRYMAPSVFETAHFDYVQDKLRILSAFYGVLRPMDGVTPYRLEMKAKLAVGGAKNLYDFWGSRIYDMVREEGGVIVNLASSEYSRCVEQYLQPGDRFFTVTFCEKSGEKLVTKGTYAKMARGEMVRYMAEHGIEEPEEIRGFDRLGYVFREELSSEKEYVFERLK